MLKVREVRRTQQKKKKRLRESNQRAERKIRGMHCPLSPYKPQLRSGFNMPYDFTTSSRKTKFRL